MANPQRKRSAANLFLDALSAKGQLSLHTCEPSDGFRLVSSRFERVIHAPPSVDRQIDLTENFFSQNIELLWAQTTLFFFSYHFHSSSSCPFLFQSLLSSAMRGTSRARSVPEPI